MCIYVYIYTNPCTKTRMDITKQAHRNRGYSAPKTSKRVDEAWEHIRELQPAITSSMKLGPMILRYFKLFMDSYGNF